jgi:hypothetical protein
VPGQAQQLSPKIRDVLARAQLEQGLSAAETARRAQAGELEDLPPTPVGETTCRNVAREAKRRQAPPDAARDAVPVDALATRAQVILDREFERLEAKSKEGALKGADATALRGLLQVAREVKALQLGFVPQAGRRTTRLLREHKPNGDGDEAKPRSRILEAVQAEADEADDD